MLLTSNGLVSYIKFCQPLHAYKERLGPECTSSVGDTENPICLKNELSNSLTTMITAGCSFRDIAQIFFQGIESIASDTSLKSSDHMVHQKAMDKYEENMTALRG
jgi:hypothetical protein